MYAASALVGAGVAPLFMTLGFFIWGSEWLGSAHTLNLFKCSLAGCMFAATGLLLNGPGLSLLFQRETLSPLLLSSLLGIVVGDNAWQQILGARRVILIDCFKPTLSAVLATALLHEPLPARLFFGSVLVCAGVAAVCRERQSDDDHEPDHGHAAAGYALAALNVTLDVFGSVLTKQSGAQLSTWEINAVRFGFASLVLGAISLSAREASLQSVQKPSSLPWWDMPAQSEQAWRRVVLGVALVTFACPALSNYALFRLPLGLSQTLSSLGPLYAVAVDRVLLARPVSWRCVAATLVALLGVCLALL